MGKRMEDNVGKKIEDFKIVALSNKSPNGYMYYVWAQCKCGCIVRLRYDQLKKRKNCGKCDDFGSTGLKIKLEVSKK